MADRRWACRTSAFLFPLLLLLESGSTPLAAARVVPHALQYRGTFTGGYALAEQKCPANTVSCPADNYCCPANTACREYAGVGYCCPSEDNCLPTLRSFPTCADPSWAMYQGKGGLFCCEAGQQGIYPGRGQGGVGLCVANTMSFAVTQTASLYTAGTATRSGTASTTGPKTGGSQGPSTAGHSTQTVTGLQSVPETSTPVASAATSSTRTCTATGAGATQTCSGARADLPLIHAVGAVGIVLTWML